MTIDRKQQLLSRHPILINAETDTLASLAKMAELIDVPSGQTLLKKGDPVKAINIVDYGRIEVIEGDSKEEGTVREVNRNESFGDISLITDAPSSSTVRALTDSVVLQLAREDFVSKIHTNPHFNNMINTEVSNFVKSERQRVNPTEGTVISIGSAESRIGKSLLGINIAAVLAERAPENVCLVDFTGRRSGQLDGKAVTDPGITLDWDRDRINDPSWSFPIFSINFPDDASEGAIRSFLGTLNDRINYLIVVLPSDYNDVIQKFIVASDITYLLTTDSEDAFYETGLLLDEIEGDLTEPEPPIEVVLNQSSSETALHRNEISDQLGVEVKHQLPRIYDHNYLDSFDTDTPYILQNPKHPYSKTARRVAHQAGGLSVGLALGSGAARGLAHIGVLDVLMTEGFEPDMVAGSSMGALIAAGYALGHTVEEMTQHARKFHESGGFFRFTDLNLPPNRSILRSTRIHNFLEDLFGDATFDDTEIPLSITVSELNHAEVKTLNEGSIVDAVLGSICIPMIFEPVQMNGFTYIDGGVLDPVPYTPLKEQGMDYVVAVNPIPPRAVFQELQPERQQPREPERDYHPLIKAIFPFGSHNLIDIGMRTIEAIESRLSEDSTSQADIVIDPYLTELSWFDFAEYERFIDQGRDSARQQVENVKSLRNPDLLRKASPVDE
ncbi:MAG: patatin-like phospholipase family protein [bacterium]